MILSQTTQPQTALIAANPDEGQNARKIAKDSSFMDAWSEQDERLSDEDMKALELENSNSEHKTDSEIEVESGDVNNVPHPDAQKVENKKPEELGVGLKKDASPEGEAITDENYQVSDVQVEAVSYTHLTLPTIYSV